MPTIYVVMGEHQTVPGIATFAYSTIESAQRRAVKMVTIMAKDSRIERVIDLENWESTVDELQERHGANGCYVEIVPVDLEE